LAPFESTWSAAGLARLTPGAAEPAFLLAFLASSKKICIFPAFFVVFACVLETPWL